MRNNYLHKNTAKRRYIKPIFLSGIDSTLDKSVLDAGLASYGYNFDFSSGVLSEGFGVSQSSIITDGVIKVWVFNRYDQDLMITEEIPMACTILGSVVYIKDGLIKQLEGVRLNAEPLAYNYNLNGKDVILISTPQDNIIVWDGHSLAYSAPYTPYITSMAIFEEKLFAIIGDKLWQSDDLDPTSWSNVLGDSGYIKIDGRANGYKKVISFLNNLFVFTDNGISKISSFSAIDKYKTSKIFVSSGKIYYKTIALCGDVIMFLATDGLYVFDGLSAKKVLGNINTMFLFDNDASANYFNGKYFLAVKIKKENQEIGAENVASFNNGLIVYDLSTKNYWISRGLDIKELCALQDELLCVTGDRRAGKIEKNGKWFDIALPKKWRFALSDVGRPDKLKIYKELNILSKTDCIVTIESEFGIKTITVFGKDFIQKYRINLMGVRFEVTFNCLEEKAYISNPSFVIAY